MAVLFLVVAVFLVSKPPAYIATGATTSLPPSVTTTTPPTQCHHHHRPEQPEQQQLNATEKEGDKSQDGEHGQGQNEGGSETTVTDPEDAGIPETKGSGCW